MRGKRNKLPVVLELEEAKKLLELPNRRYPTGVHINICTIYIKDIA